MDIRGKTQAKNQVHHWIVRPQQLQSAEKKVGCDVCGAACSERERERGGEGVPKNNVRVGRTVALVRLVSGAADVTGAQRGALAGWHADVIDRPPHPTSSDAAAPADQRRE